MFMRLLPAGVSARVCVCWCELVLLHTEAQNTQLTGMLLLACSSRCIQG